MIPKDEVEVTRQWISQFVIGLNLCPFARRVYEAEQIRYVLSAAIDRNTLLEELIVELDLLTTVSPSSIETTFLIHPKVLNNFLDYNDFIGLVDRMLRKTGRDQAMQIASFHPQYEFIDSKADAVENYSNRSPYPMLHILRSSTVAKVTGNQAEMDAIPRRNIETLNALGIDEVIDRLGKITTITD